jgi:hypothetical protein
MTKGVKARKRKTRAKCVYFIMTYTAQCNATISLPDDDSDGSKQLKVQNNAMLADVRTLTPAHRSVVSDTVAQCSTTTRDYGGEKGAVVDGGGMRRDRRDTATRCWTGE